MTLDEFLAQAALDLEMFAASYRQHAQAEPAVYEGEHDPERWWQEFYAYQTILFLEDRRRH